MRNTSTKREAVDPICGMKVDPEHAAGSSEWHGETYYFCSLGCKEKFDAQGTASGQAQAKTSAPARTSR
jgi:Cu+-exporting ATPase